MKFTIITPTDQQEFTINWLKVNTPQGDFVIQHGHAPTIVTLTPNKEIIFSLQDHNKDNIEHDKENDSEEKIMITNGILEVNRNSIRLISI